MWLNSLNTVNFAVYPLVHLKGIAHEASAPQVITSCDIANRAVPNILG